ncbi:MAG: hypothetical protein NC203_10780, partial [Firmicutes bacterium]|nr:hypothetical protein [Bacillota bacterium]
YIMHEKIHFVGEDLDPPAVHNNNFCSIRLFPPPEKHKNFPCFSDKLTLPKRQYYFSQTA